MNIRFYLNHRSITCSLAGKLIPATQKNGIITRSTGMKVDDESWDKRKQRVKGKVQGARHMNKKLNRIESSLKELYALHEGEEEQVLLSILEIKQIIQGDAPTKLSITDLFTKFIDVKIEEGLSPRTIKSYEQVLELFHKFSEGKPSFSRAINDNLVARFSDFIEKDYEDSTRKLYLDKFYGFLRYLKEQKVIKELPKYKKLKQKENKPFALTKEELSQIERVELPTEKLEVVRDWFVFACYTSLRISDTQRLCPEHFGEALNPEKKIGEYLNIVLKKTQTEVAFFLLPQAQIIASKRGYEYDGPSDSVSNQRLKVIAKLAGIERWEKVTNHTARHTFITHRLEDGWTDSRIMRHTGHKDSDMLRRYESKSVEHKLFMSQVDTKDYFPPLFRKAK